MNWIGIGLLMDLASVGELIFELHSSRSMMLPNPMPVECNCTTIISRGEQFWELSLLEGHIKN